jgi:hypothetical protein
MSIPTISDGCSQRTWVSSVARTCGQLAVHFQLHGALQCAREDHVVREDDVKSAQRRHEEVPAHELAVAWRCTQQHAASLSAAERHNWHGRCVHAPCAPSLASAALATAARSGASSMPVDELNTAAAASTSLPMPEPRSVKFRLACSGTYSAREQAVSVRAGARHEAHPLHPRTR